jgi:toxin-antitoxin system PIN domain toxin
VTFLLDVNVLIALVDASHVGHEAAHDWFAGEGHLRWATCPITENGFVRILGNPKYPNALATPADALALLARLASVPGHVFWPDDISLREAARFAAAKILTTSQITDSYLLALAASKGDMLATLDRRLSTPAVADGAKSLRVINA